MAATCPTPTSLPAIQQRAWMNRHIRSFFHDRGVLEVETPALSTAGNTDPQIESFTVNTAKGGRYLHTSPEYPMKRLLAAGSGDIYQICKVWRGDESGAKHNPEFTLLEYYRVGFSYQQLMHEVAELLQDLIPSLKQNAKFISYRQCFLERLGIDPHICSKAELADCAKLEGLDVSSSLSKQEWLDLLFTHVIEAEFSPERLSFVYHYPAEQSALSCVIEHEGVHLAERFEVYCGDIELGNGYQELTSQQANQQKLQRDAEWRKATGQTEIPVDQQFLASLAKGFPRSSGVAIGLDRVLMCRMKKTTLNQVISFPWELA